ncbi:GntR family transcriptional regulator [Halalkalibacter kiskunsagensis]|uniref:GntR family transcriptional regulator n=1 Tax=Halalkalibacter kiskunsagensis TaxID=1548599 RepID=A0ABV6KCK9_9BACI
MTKSLDSTQRKPRYEIIYEEIKEKIVTQDYKVGDRIPSEKELIDYYKVSRITTKRALDQLVNDGMIERIPGKGSFVINKENEGVLQAESSKGYLIGFVFPDFDESHVADLFKALNEATSQCASSLVVKQTFGDVSLEKEAIASLLQLGVDGMMILPVSGEYFNEEVLKLTINKFPHVLIDRYFKGIHTTSICTDNINAAKEAVNYLFDLRHQQIAILSPPFKDISAIEDRVDGFIQAYAERGVMVNKDIWLTDLTSELPTNKRNDELIDRDIQLIKGHLQTHPNITAIFAVHYNIAVLARIAALELGLTVPRDLSIICFDSPKKSRDRFQFTHVKQNQQEMGKKATEAIVSQIENKRYPEKTFLEAVLIEGESTVMRT